MFCIYEQNKVARIDSGVHQTFSWLWSWSKWLPYDVTMFSSQSVSFPRKQISSCRQCWLLTQFFKQKKNILNAVNSFCWFDKGYSGIIPEFQNVFLSYPGWPTQTSLFVWRVTWSEWSPAVCRLCRIPTACSGEVRVKFRQVETPYRVRARVHRHPAKSMATSLIQGLSRGVTAC